MTLCKTLKCFGFRGSAPDSTGGADSTPPDPLAEISYILFEIVTEMREKQFWTYNTKFPIALKNYLCL